MNKTKQVTIKLFFTAGKYYIEIGDALYPIKEKIAMIVQEKELLEIRRCTDLKEMQETSLNDKSKPDSL